MKKIYLFASVLVCTVALSLAFVSCETESDREEQEERQKEIDPTQWASAINGTWEYVVKNGRGHISSSIGLKDTAYCYTESSVERYVFNTVSNTGSYYYESERLYDGESEARVTKTDYDFAYEFNQSYDDFFQSYSTSIKITVTDVREGAKYHKSGDSRWLDVYSVTDKELTLDRTTYTKK